MSDLRHYTQKIYNRCEELRSIVTAERAALATEIRTHVLLPFCRKHKLTMRIGIYANTFYGDAVDGDADDYELSYHIPTEEANKIHQYLNLSFMGDSLFDYDMDMDITEKDLE
jgi:hypothetical protein